MTDQATTPEPKRKKNADGPAALSRFQTFTMVRLHRSQLKNADYNPRVHPAEAKRRLKGNLKGVGLLEPVIWNVRTGNLVGGHMRLSCLDSLEKTTDYLLDVAQVDLSPEQEKEQNIALNNPNLAGSYDAAGLEKMFKDDKIDWDAAGFTTAEVYEMFGTAPLIAEPDKMVEMAEKIREAQKRYERISNLGGARDTDTYMRVLVFKDDAGAREFDQAVGHDGGRYVDPRRLKFARAEA